MKTIRVVVKNPREPAKIVMIENSLDALQKLVGGSIEAIRPFPRVHAYVNEEGKLLGLLANFSYGSDVIAGPAVFSKADAEGEEIGFEDEEEAQEIVSKLARL